MSAYGCVWLSKVGKDNTSLLFQLMKSTFLSGPSRNYFMDVVEKQADSAEGAIQMLEKYYLGMHSRRVNNDVCMDLSFEMVKKKRMSNSM